MPVPPQNGETKMSNDAELRRKILEGILHRLLGQRADEVPPELKAMSDQELEGALSYAIGLRAEGERLRREVFHEQAHRRQRQAEQMGGRL
jgi:hypothetical protein